MDKQRRARFNALGEFLYGENWKKPLANAIEKNEKTVRRWAKGEWDAPEDILEAMAKMAEAKQAKLKRATSGN